jgi:glycosyltransferase involved in cell wall biosynthesis
MAPTYFAGSRHALGLDAVNVLSSRAYNPTYAAAPLQPSPGRQDLPTVDVIVPCYNYGRFLHTCINSVLDQQGCQVRVLIIDDCSTDDSLVIARAIAATDARIRVIAHAENRGHIGTYNEGIDWLAAEYMLLLSSDDMLAPMALARAVTLMESNPKVTFVYGTSIQFTDEATVAAEYTSPQVSRLDLATGSIQQGSAFIRQLCAKPINPVETATAVVRTAMQKRVGGYRPELPHAGDMEMWLRLAAHGDVGFIPTPQAFTRIHTKNMRHSAKAERMRGDYEQRHWAFRIFFTTHADQLNDARSLACIAYRSLAEEVLWAAARGFEEADDPAVAVLVDLARTIDCSIIRTPLWWKTVARRTLGRGLWGTVASMLMMLRRGRRASRSTSS